MSKKFRLLMVLVLMTGLLGGLMSGSTVSADPIVGVRIQIPRIDMGDIFGTGTWSTKLQIQNVGTNPTWAAVIYWGAYSDECPPNDPGVLSTWNYQGLAPNGIWTLTPPSGARSALVYSFADPWTVAKPTASSVGTGQPLAVTVDRWGPDAESYQLSSSYVGISLPMEGASWKYYVPYVMYDYLNKLDTVITIQNSWDYCTSVWIWYKEQGNCEYQVSQHITELAPGEAIRVGPPAAVTAGWADVAFTPLLVPGPAGWLGSAYISAQVPLGIIADQMTLTTMANNQAVLLTFRGLPYKPVGYDPLNPYLTAWDKQWYADLLYREISGWDASIQVQNLTQVSKPTFVTVDFMNESGDEILFVGDWVCRNGAVTFYLPAITDLGVNHPFGYVGAAEIASVQQIDYPGGHEWGEPIFALVDIKKRKLVDPITGLVRPTVKGENQGGAYNAHPYGEKWNAWYWAMPFIAKEGNGVTSRIALRNNGNCNKFYGKIFFWDETGTLVGLIHTPWLMPKHLKIFDLAYQGFLYPGWVGAATFAVLGVEQLCDVDNDGHVDNEPVMPSIVVMNYGWEAELGIAPPATAAGDLTRIYEATPYALGNKICEADLLGIVTDDNFDTVLEGVTVTVPDGWIDEDAVGETGDGGMYEIEGIATYGLYYPYETCYDGVTAEKTGYLTAIVDEVCLDCGEDEVLDFALICNTNTIDGTVTQYVTPTITGGPPVEGATVTCTWDPYTGTLDTGIMTDTTDATGYFEIEDLPKEVDIECVVEKDGYDDDESVGEYFGDFDCGELDTDDVVLNCYAEVKAQVWNDLDGQGDLDANEPLLPGEMCTLYNEDASVILDYATTDEYGICKFFVGEDVYGPEFDWLEGVQIGVGSELGAVPSVWPCDVFVVNIPL